MKGFRLWAFGFTLIKFLYLQVLLKNNLNQRPSDLFYLLKPLFSAACAC